MREHGAVVLPRLVRNGLNLLEGVPASYGLRLVHSASILKDSLLFNLVVRLVVQGKVGAEVAAVTAHNGSAVTHVDDEDLLLHQKRYDGTGS